MKINLRQPKYALPIILLPFFLLFFFIWHNNLSKPEKEVKEQNGLNQTVGGVSSDIRKKQLANKLDAYRNSYKDADGLSAVAVIHKEDSSNPTFDQNAEARRQQVLDSIRRSLSISAPDKKSVPVDKRRNEDMSEASIASAIARQQHAVHSTPVQSAVTLHPDPMEMFKRQMMMMDSLTKENDPAFKAERQKREAAEKLARLKAGQVRLPVSRSDESGADFNSIFPHKDNNFISAVIDEEITGFAGSRIRIRLLDDIKAGNFLIGKGTYLFAEISGFTGQRVTLSVTSILSGERILPVKLELYDLDGLPGLYVPSSTFREFTRDLGTNAVQGVSIDGGPGTNQFMMSSIDKVFQSTSSAIAGLIRKNKAKIKYNSYIYLIDPEALQNAQKSY